MLIIASSESRATAPAGLGVYTGPGPKAVAGATAFAQWSGHPVAQILDFLPAATWSDITQPAWLLQAHAAPSTPRLVLSVPLLTDDPHDTLAQCATGQYNDHWTTLARNLTSHGLGDTTLRPGWEFNGNWYRWSAASAPPLFAKCFRQFVASVRTVPNQHITFDWNPNLGSGDFPAEAAYPGDDYVDYIGVDVYDISWTSYPAPDGADTAQARDQVWNQLLTGDHGLRFWADFARTHNKKLSIPEWAATWRRDGHGGGDNVTFISNMLDFITDPVNRVAYANYFNSTDRADLTHNLTRAGTKFPAAAQEYRLRISEM